ncbi:hypothetical protein [Peribacillus aracenensis]|uniref:hypothetical protein n=1 Tax=Peribacillus aracenensis TaxID=2976708 RepID=UPI0021A589BB|nr:hypothetical protein [Peribacillus sp. BBB004]
MTSLNPVFTIGNQIIEGIKLHLKMNSKDAKEYAIEMLNKVGIPRTDEMLKEYPYALSGGMRQRVSYPSVCGRGNPGRGNAHD